MKILTTIIGLLSLAFIATAQTVQVNSPAGIAGSYAFSASFCNGWGADITTGVWTGDAVLIDDGIAPITDGCSAPINSLSGKITLIDRGACLFSDKALTAQNAGAIAVIIFNNIPGGNVVNMAAGPSGSSVTIPVVMLSYEDGQTIRTALMTETVNISIGGSGSDDDCDGITNICDRCPGGDDNGPCNATSFPGFENVPADWACGYNNNKIKICHNGNTLCVSPNSLPDHLGHGDFLGPCKSCPQSIVAPIDNGYQSVANGLKMDLMPNPASSKMTVNLQGMEPGEALLTLYDHMGRLVLEQKLVDRGQNIELQLAQFVPGSYFVRVVAANGSLTQKLMITR